MSYLEKLKKLIGEEAFKKVEADLNGKELIVNDGTYIPKEKFDKLNDEKKDLQKDKDKLTGDLKTAQDDLKKVQDDNKKGKNSVEEQIAELNKKLQDQDSKIAAKDKELQLAKYEGVLKDALTEAGVKNPKNLKLLMKEFDLEKVELDDNGKIKGFDESVKKLQEDYKPLFGEEKFGGTPPGQGKENQKEVKELSTEEFFESEVFCSK
ncbi:MAG: phage scaffolding protein [Ignavibacterium sp.]|nr:phage scaffolding protein [Ignavibacterium sp.]